MRFKCALLTDNSGDMNADLPLAQFQENEVAVAEAIARDDKRSTGIR